MFVTGQSYNPWKMFIGCFVPNSIARSTTLSSTAKLVFGRLCQYAGRDGCAFPSYRTIGGEVGISQRQAIRAIGELASFGLIAVESYERSDGGSGSNRYRFLWHSILEEIEPSVEQATEEERELPDDFPHSVADDQPGEDDGDDTPSVCHRGHPPLSVMSPKERSEENLVEQKNQQTGVSIFRDKVSGTPLDRLSNDGVAELEHRHGWETLLWATDTVVTAWRKRRFTILNPGGYLHTVCQELVACGGEEIKQPVLASSACSEPLADTADESSPQKTYWHGLDTSEQQLWLDAARLSVRFEWQMSEASATAIACSMAWDAFCKE